jgi:rubredoxin
MRAEFSKATKLEAWRRAEGHCEGCGQLFEGRRPEYDHIVAAELGGSNDLDNAQVLCPKCHRAKTSLEDIPCIAKSNRVRDKYAGIRRSKYRWPKRSLR